MEDSQEVQTPKIVEPEILTPEEENVILRKRNQELEERNKILEQLARIDEKNRPIQCPCF